MILFLLPLYICFIRSEGEDVTPEPITISLSKGLKVQDVTNTLLYSIALTNFTTLVGDNQVPSITEGTHIVYIPTILMYLKAVTEIPSPTLTITPAATIKLKSSILKPGILVGVTFAILFVIGVVYTSLCRKPQAARRPKPTKTTRGANDDAFNRAKSKRAGVQTRSAGGGTRSTRSGSVATRARSGSTQGSARNSRGGRNSRSGSQRGARGRTSSRL